MYVALQGHALHRIRLVAVNNAGMDEVILPRIGKMVRFDGQVVEVFIDRNSDSRRGHVALMKEPKISGSRVLIVEYPFYVNADEMSRLRPLLDKITAAVRAARAV
jgi:hypothetical protein